VPVAFTRVPFKGDIIPPTREADLGPYPLGARVFSSDRVVWADTHAEVVAALSRHGTDYTNEHDPRVRQQMRAEWLVGCQIQLQAFICGEAQCNGDWQRLTEREKTVLLGRRTLTDQPHDFGTEALLSVDIWCTPVPLVCLVGTGFPEWPVVTDNDSLIVIDCGGCGPDADEYALRSLARSGYLHLWTLSVGA
jgi:hypothetical protein